MGKCQQQGMGRLCERSGAGGNAEDLEVREELDGC